MRKLGRSDRVKAAGQDPESVLAWVRDELARLPHLASVVFGMSIAHRLFRTAEARTEYAESWRPTVDALWRWSSGEEAAYYDVSEALAQYLVSPQNHCAGQDGPSDADTPCVLATVYVAASMIFGGSDGAILAARVSLDAAAERVESQGDSMLPVDELNASTEVQAELRQQVDAVRAIVEHADSFKHGSIPQALRQRLRDN